ncbi:Crp/Fnr family transcriptional regulator [Ochrobactrum chromiisoli]|uniref:Crp/Fnr family transcriptional regulator n=1 Tax=Ochrobactrum chromiisoli TaxID=2993941 RepID=A0ABT3QT75_9HYPH|nr:Crp/Fnr family transcriptional regulator [Ochrobactrum chromiisoli]MCX2698831.1 Crp/Fnr family transcriptional regulator [Ochrobactrum chromiisoli]
MATIDRGLVRKLSLFAKMGDNELDKLVSYASSRHIAQSESIFEQGDDAVTFYLLLYGRLKVNQVTSDGQQIIVRMVHPGDLFGFAKALQRHDYPGTAVAVTDSFVLGWPAELWDYFVEQNPGLAMNAIQTIGKRLEEAHTRIREMSTEEVERRVAHVVLRLAQKAGKKEENGIRIDFPITRQEIAEMTGTTLHTVSRILSGWESKGLVLGGRQKLTVTNTQGIRRLAEGSV